MAKQGPGNPGRQFPNQDPTLEKALPSNIEAERLILGVILLDNSTINQAVERLKPDDFFLGSHRLIYSKMLKLYEGGLGIDPVTLQEELRKAGELDAVGGSAYIASLFDGVPRFSNIDNYTKIVKGKGTLRKLITASNQIMARAFDDEDEPEIILDEAERLILSIAEDRIKQGFVHIGDVAGKQLELIEEIAGRGRLVTGIPTGFNDLDQLTSGLQRGDLIIIAARPSMGKCLSADSEIVLSDGRIATIKEIYQSRNATLLTLSDDLKFSLTTPSAYVDDGIKPVYRVTTRLGRFVDSTLTHPFLTIDGWQQLGELKVGDRIALPRRLEIFGKEQISEGKVKLLAYLIGDGNLTNANPSLTNTNPLLQEDFAEAVSVFPGLKIRSYIDGTRAPSFYVSGDTRFIKEDRKEFANRLSELLGQRGAAHSLAQTLGVSPSLVSIWQKGECAPSQALFERICQHLNVSRCELAPNGDSPIGRTNRNPLTLWLQELGIWGCKSHEKFVPGFVFRLEKPLIALFLNRLFATDGWVALNKGQNATIGYATVSERLARQVQHLLLRFGIIAKLRKRGVRYANERRTSWQLDITHASSIRIFSVEISIFGKEEKLAQAIETLAKENNKNNRDLIPVGIWREITKISRKRLEIIAGALGSEQLRDLAQSDVYWDEILSIEYQGDKQVYDLTIPETHNFVANDICVHNTAFSLNIAQNASQARDATGRRYEGVDKAVVGIFSLEMSKEQLVQRLLCSQAGVDAHRLRSGFLSKEEWRKLATAVGELAEAPIFLDDSPGISVLEMRAKARRLKNEQKRLDLLIVDYLQLMTGRGRYESRQQEVSQISRELKILAKELNVPLIALSQLSRAPETRTGSHKPQLSDLRESGSIEQDADVVMFIYREEVYKQETEKQNIAEIIIGKQRNGPVDTVELVFLKQFTRFGPKYQE